MHIEELANTFAEPLTLAQAKQYARIEIVEDDAFVITLIASARKLAEAFMLRRLVEHKFEILFDRSEVCEVIHLEDATKIKEVTEFEITDSEDAATAGVLDTDFRISKNRLILDLSTGLFDSLRVFDALKIQYTSGVELPSQAIKDAMGMILTHMYENREAVTDTTTTGQVNEIPVGAASLLAPFKHYSV